MSSRAVLGAGIPTGSRITLALMHLVVGVVTIAGFLRPVRQRSA